MYSKSRKDIKAIAKKRGYVRYSRLNKDDLIGLVTRGYHKVPKSHYYYCVHSTKGLVPSQFVQPPKINKLIGPIKYKYAITTEMYDESSRIISGLDLTGMFDAKFIPDIIGPPDSNIWITYGGWVIHEKEYPNFARFTSLYSPL
jgi:hypothetical protein